MTDINRTIGSRLRELSRAESFGLLGQNAFVGHVGFVHADRPMILPVNYLLDGESILFRTAGGTLLSTLDSAAVAFEVDDNRPLVHGGWSVLVHGTAQRIDDSQEIDTLRRGPLRAWAWRAADDWFRIPIDDISGRRLAEP